MCLFLCSCNILSVQDIRVAKQERVLAQETRQTQSRKRGKRLSPDDEHIFSLTLTTRLDNFESHESLQFRLKIMSALEELAALEKPSNIKQFELPSNLTPQANATMAPQANATTTLSLNQLNTSTDTQNNTVQLQTTTGSILATNSSENTSVEAELCRFRVIVLDIQTSQNRKKRQVNEEQNLAITFAMTEDDELITHNEIEDLLSGQTEIAQAIGAAINQNVSVNITDEIAEQSLPEDDVVAEEEKIKMKPCWVTSIVLGSLLISGIIGFIIYLMYETEIEKKRRNNTAEKNKKADSKLASENDKLLQENTELKSQLKNSKHPVRRSNKELKEGDDKERDSQLVHSKKQGGSAKNSYSLLDEGGYKSLTHP